MSKLDHLTASNTAVLLIDHNAGFTGTVGSGPQTDISQAAAALARIAKVFGLPLIVTNGDPAGIGGDLVP
jgi:nicotinamidase-related amidase